MIICKRTRLPKKKKNNQTKIVHSIILCLSVREPLRKRVPEYNSKNGTGRPSKNNFFFFFTFKAQKMHDSPRQAWPVKSRKLRRKISKCHKTWKRKFQNLVKSQHIYPEARSEWWPQTWRNNDMWWFLDVKFFICFPSRSGDRNNTRDLTFTAQQVPHVRKVTDRKSS